MTCATATTDKLVDLLKRLHSGDDPQSVRGWILLLHTHSLSIRNVKNVRVENIDS